VARASAVTLRQLRAFVAVAEEGSIVRAALRIHLTPSALSMLVSSLEGELGVRLFERTTRRMVLTDAGQALLPSLLKMFDQFDDALDDVRELTERRHSRLRISASPLIAAAMLPPVMAGFQRAHPDVKLSVQDVAVDAVAQSVRNGEADVGVCTADVDGLDLKVVPVVHDRLVLVCLDSHPFAGKAQVRWADLEGQPLVLMQRGSGLRKLAERGLAMAKLAIEPAFEVAQVSTAIGLVEAGLAVAVLPSYAVRRARAVGVHATALVDPVIERAIVALHSPERPLTALADDFLQRLRAAALPIEAEAAHAGKAARPRARSRA
jgi:DNA-binding transcriptional LysR family regulator